MSNIKTALALSDLHLGRDVSYLNSREKTRYQKNRGAVLELLNRLGPQDEIILNGDILELSLGGLDEVYDDVKEFFSLLSETGPYKKIVYVPGNHDHHFWRTLGEQVYICGRINKKEKPLTKKEYPFYFVDRRFSSKNSEQPCNLILPDLWPEGKQAPEFVVKYPHHLARVTLANGKERYFLFTHGHFLEAGFKPVNNLIEPAHLEELEAFNCIWIEALCYHLGHAGRLSQNAKIVADAYEKGGKEARKKVTKIMNSIYDNITMKAKLRWPKTWLVKWGLKSAIKFIPKEERSGLFKVAINKDLKAEIKKYVQKYIVMRYRDERARELYLPSDKNIPSPLTFVFGHTHRPTKDKDEKVIIQGETYPVANTGGWLRIDSDKSVGENAGILVVNQNGVRWESLEGRLE